MSISLRNQDILQRDRFRNPVPRWDKVFPGERSQYPFSPVVLIQMYAEFDSGEVRDFPRGTGWFYSPTVVVTAAHCTEYPPPGPLDDSPLPCTLYLQVKPVSSIPNAQSFSVRTVVHHGYDADTSRNDIALLHLSPGGGNEHVGTLAPSVVSSARARLEALVPGFQLDARFKESYGDMVWHRGLVKKIDSDFLYYDIDTVGGHSGAPVFAEVNGGLAVVGMHVAGPSVNQTAESLNCNVGLRMDAAMIHWIDANS